MISVQRVEDQKGSGRAAVAEDATGKVLWLFGWGSEVGFVRNQVVLKLAGLSVG